MTYSFYICEASGSVEFCLGSKFKGRLIHSKTFDNIWLAQNELENLRYAKKFGVIQ